MSLHSSRLLKTPTTHTRSIAQSLDDLWAYTSEVLVRWSWNPLCAFAQQEIARTLSAITIGQLTIRTSESTLEFGSSDNSELHAELSVRSPTFWTRVAMFKDLGFAEAYMFGEVDCDDMPSLLKILIANRQQLDGLNHFWASVLSKGQRLTTYRFLGDLSTSRANISAHYDLGNTMFAAFLSEDMNYSSAIFKDYKEDLYPKKDHTLESLESAQQRKMEMILTKAGLKPGQRVLEIGTGWGSLSILAATRVDCQIDTITLSAEQCALARERIKAAGVSDRITVHCMDFREALLKPEWAGAFDRFISIEMIENVGKDFIAEYWRVVDWALKPTAGVGVVQVITMPEARIYEYDQGADFIQKWSMFFPVPTADADPTVVFPGCYIPSHAFLIETMNRGSHGRLTVDSAFNIGMHYARTLREWKRKFLRNWDSVIAAKLETLYKLNPHDLEVFKRKWTYYFDYCEAGFVTRTLGDHVITFTRDGNVDFGCALRVDDD